MLDLNYFIMGGLILLSAFLVGKFTHWAKVTAVVGYLLTGILLGQQGLGVVDLSIEEMSLFTWFALGFIGFIIGGKLSFSKLKRRGKNLLYILIGDVSLPFLLVMSGVYLVKGSLALGAVFGALACASAPAGTIAVIHEYRARGSLTETMVAVMGLDDALGVIIFAVTLSVSIGLLSGSGTVSSEMLLMPLREIGGALVLGILAGGVLALAERKVQEREELVVLTFGLLLGCVGIAYWADFSVILAGMAFGVTLLNAAPHVSRVIFEETDRISLPIFIVFFVIAGMELRLGIVVSSGILAVVYILFRTAGKLAGNTLGAKVGGAEENIQRYLGFGLLSQAGVALGLALYASQKLSEIGEEGWGGLIITTIAATSIVFEIIGPISARFALIRSGEVTER